MKKFFASSFCLPLISNSHLVATSPPETQSSHFFFNAELLYWTSYADEVVLTNHASNILQTDTFTDTAVLHPNFDWDVGYRFGFGYYFPDPVWSVDLYWTHFRTKASQYKFTDTDDINNTNGQMGMFPIWSLASDITAYDYVSDDQNVIICWHHPEIAALIAAFGYLPPSIIYPVYPEDRYDLVWLLEMPPPVPSVTVDPILQELLYGDASSFP